MEKAKQFEPHFITVYCSECERETTMQWDIEQDGFKAYCPYCGKRLMMCSYCDHLENCDYDKDTDTCRYNNPQKDGAENSERNNNKTAKGYVELEIPDCCVGTDNRVHCPLAWHTRFCSKNSPKGDMMTGADWLEVYKSGKRPNWCPIHTIPEIAGETYFTDEEYRILLSALSHERKVCKKVQEEGEGEIDLIRVMDSLELKIRNIQYKGKHNGKE